MISDLQEISSLDMHSDRLFGVTISYSERGVAAYASSQDFRPVRL